jgi:hypothetical protein
MTQRSTSQKTTSSFSFTPIQTGLLQRKCNSCDRHKIAGGECTNCQTKNGLQRKLTIGASNDPLEQEADQVADLVMGTSTNPAVSSAPPRIQRFAGGMTEGVGTVPASVDSVLSSPGTPLERSLQLYEIAPPMFCPKDIVRLLLLQKLQSPLSISIIQLW